MPAPAAIANLQPGRWLELPNTKISSVLPVPTPQGDPAAIVLAWGGGTVDTVRSRLIVWGGGHGDYYGNELYALDLRTMTINRITEPSPLTSQSNCTSALSDGTPTARHTYDGLAYVSHLDKFFSVNGSLSPCGNADKATWLYDFPSARWQLAVANSPTSLGFGTMAEYDAATGQVLVKDGVSFYSYSVEGNRYTKLNSSDQVVDYRMTAAFDSKRRKFVMMGNGTLKVIDLGTKAMSNLATTNTPSFIAGGAGSPGVAYDPVADRIVAWSGGSNVYALNMDTATWSLVSTGIGPAAGAPQQGTFGRWAYIPQYRVFALINGTDQNAWVFRLSN